MKLTVVHVSGSRAGATEVLEAATITVGRDPQNLLRFDPVQDDKVSSFHARLEPQGEGLLLVDLGSKNGTFLNGHRITGSIQVPSGAVLTFGDKGPNVVVQFGAAAAGTGPGAATPGARPAAPSSAPPHAPTPAPGRPPAAAKLTEPAPAPAGKSSAKKWAFLGTTGAFLGAVVLMLVLLAVSPKVRSMVPAPLQGVLRQVPGVGKLFTPPAPPRLPGGG